MPEISERYGLLLETYLLACGDQLVELWNQKALMDSLLRVANVVKTKKRDRNKILTQELRYDGALDSWCCYQRPSHAFVILIQCDDVGGARRRLAFPGTVDLPLNPAYVHRTAPRHLHRRLTLAWLRLQILDHWYRRGTMQVPRLLHGRSCAHLLALRAVANGGEGADETSLSNPLDASVVGAQELRSARRCSSGDIQVRR